MRTGRIIAVLLLALLLAAGTNPDSPAQVTAFSTDCTSVGAEADIYQFVATCPGRASSPDGRFAIVQQRYLDEQPLIELQDAQGRTLDRLPDLSDDMPLTIAWAPNSRWFFANHYLGSGLAMLRLFEIVEGKAVERRALAEAAISVAMVRYPCLPHDMVIPLGIRWTSDSRSIVLATTGRVTACMEARDENANVLLEIDRWSTLWMIGEAVTGAIDLSSVRVAPDDQPFTPPTDGPYAVP